MHTTTTNTQDLTAELVKSLVSKVKLNKSTLTAIANDGRNITDDAFVYHVRPKGSLYSLHEGYIGITTGSLIDGTCNRWEQHRKSLIRVIQGDTQSKHYEQKMTWGNLGDIDSYEFRCIYKSDLITSLLIEKALRPEKNIGWNRSIGGNWNQAVEGFNWLEQDVKIKKMNNGKWKLLLSSYDDLGNRKRVHINSSMKHSDVEAHEYLNQFMPLLRERLAYLNGDISDLKPEVLRVEIDKIKVELGGKPTRTYSEPRSLHYFFADCSTHELINSNGLNGHGAARELGINPGNITQGVNTILGTEGKPKLKTLPYNNGRCYLAGFRDLKTNQITFNERTTQAVKEQIMGN